MDKVEFAKGNTYKLSYSENFVSRVWKGTNEAAEYDTREFNGTYEYIGSRGGKLHFYDQQAGRDVLLTKKEAIEAYKKGN